MNQYEINKKIEELVKNKSEFTADELIFISRYTGMGGIAELASEGLGAKYEFFTPDEIVKKMWALAYKYGYGVINEFNDNSVFEPSVGTGNFLKYAPKNVYIEANEISDVSAKICQVLYPNAVIKKQSFEQNFIDAKNNITIKSKIKDLKKFSLVIGNPPYGKMGGKYLGMGERDYSHAPNWIQYFIFRGLDLLQTNGLLIYIVGAEQFAGGTLFLDGENTKTKELIFEKSELIDAYRLPTKLFETTGVSTEILVFRKK
jgi:type I restriction-modification system DNA methylase subunit